MDKTISDILNQSMDMSGAVFKQLEQIMKTFDVSGQARGGTAESADWVSGLLQLNQLTLSSLELIKNWEKGFESMTLFFSAFPGWLEAKDDKYRAVEEKTAALKKRLDEQEKLIRELQSKLNANSEEDDEGAEDPVQILSDFLTAQNEKFRNLLKQND